jgi:hypothetical protein
MTSTADVTVLYRPVGPKELELIKESGCREFPSRLPGQPIFYPVLNEEYAVQIARDWNAGNRLRFRVLARSEFNNPRRRGEENRAAASSSQCKPNA